MSKKKKFGISSKVLIFAVPTAGKSFLIKDHASQSFESDDLYNIIADAIKDKVSTISKAEPFSVSVYRQMYELINSFGKVKLIVSAPLSGKFVSLSKMMNGHGWKVIGFTRTPESYVDEWKKRNTSYRPDLKESKEYMDQIHNWTQQLEDDVIELGMNEYLADYVFGS